ncbi:hypothetical protein KCU88_g86, partial [Aureobasidium melanogenum]
LWFERRDLDLGNRSRPGRGLPRVQHYKLSEPAIHQWHYLGILYEKKIKVVEQIQASPTCLPTKVPRVSGLWHALSRRIGWKQIVTHFVVVMFRCARGVLSAPKKLYACLRRLERLGMGNAKMKIHFVPQLAFLSYPGGGLGRNCLGSCGIYLTTFFPRGSGLARPGQVRSGHNSRSAWI